MKNISELSEKEFSKMVGKTYQVYEKMDAVYFKAHIHDNIFVVRNSKDKVVDDVDCIVNNMYIDIISFVNSLDIKNICKRFKDIKIGFFYFPKHKTRTITYNNIPEGSFMLSDYYVNDKMLRNDEVLSEILGPGVLPMPYICDCTIDENFSRFDSPEFIVRNLIDHTASGNDFHDIEGIVLRRMHESYEIRVRDVYTNFDASIKLIYRDTLLRSFVNTLSRESLDLLLSSNKSYVEKICDLFLEYVNTTELFNTMYMDADDFLPPVEGYIGDVAFDKLPQMVSMICRNDELYKNVLRVLLVTFNNSPLTNKFKRFNEKDRAILTEISVRSK